MFTNNTTHVVAHVRAGVCSDHAHNQHRACQNNDRIQLSTCCRS
ncbi:hypothetical protein M3J09_011346 [Ascochyta lentis]